MDHDDHHQLKQSAPRTVGRSNTSRFLLDSFISPETSEVTKYERLHNSLKSEEELQLQEQEQKARVWGTKKGPREMKDEEKAKDVVEVGSTEAEDKKKKKGKSSWLPDPERRWPVQGW